MKTNLKPASIVDISLRKVAIVAGIGYLVVFIFGIFFGVIQNFIVPGDASTTANNIIESKSLFRIAIAGLLIVLIADAIVAWALYVFLKPISKSLSLLTAWFRLLYTAIFGILLINLFPVLHLLSGTDYLTVFEPNQLHAQVMIFLNVYQSGLNVAYIFFGLHIFGLGYLILKSGYIPRILGILLIVAAVGYQIDSFASVLSPSYASNETNFIIFIAIPAIISELSLTLWLLFKGGKQIEVR